MLFDRVMWLVMDYYFY